MDRRHFFKKILLRIFYLFATIVLAYPVFSFITFRKWKKKTIIFTPEEQRARVSLKEGVYLIKADEETFALSSRCTHLGCVVQYDQFAGRFRCPCHGSIFDQKGQKLTGPAKKDLLKIPMTRKENGEILVSMEL